MWVEEDVCEPVNLYGQTKLDMENLIKEKMRCYVILRSSMIYGPPVPYLPIKKLHYAQFI